MDSRDFILKSVYRSESLTVSQHDQTLHQMCGLKLNKIRTGRCFLQLDRSYFIVSMHRQIMSNNLYLQPILDQISHYGTNTLFD